MTEKNNIDKRFNFDFADQIHAQSKFSEAEGLAIIGDPDQITDSKLCPAISYISDKSNSKLQKTAQFSRNVNHSKLKPSYTTKTAFSKRLKIMEIKEEQK